MKLINTKICKQVTIFKIENVTKCMCYTFQKKEDKIHGVPKIPKSDVHFVRHYSTVWYQYI